MKLFHDINDTEAICNDVLWILNECFECYRDEMLTVGIAGSFALWHYERNVLGIVPSFQPGDCDVYFTVAEEMQYTGALVRLRMLCSTHGTKVIHSKTFKKHYVETKGPIEITDVMIQGCPMNISLIFNTYVKSVPDIIGRFDLDVVMLCMDVEVTNYCLSDDVAKAIKDRKATVMKEFRFESSVPTNWERGLLYSTLERMEKYKERGYAITNFPSIVADGKYRHSNDYMTPVKKGGH